MSIKEILTRILNAIKTLQDRDYIVEQGTSGGWTYRKWNSGISECWGRFNASLSWSAYTVSGLYYNSTAWVIAFPFTITNACATVTCRGVGSNVGWIGNADVDNNNVKVTLVRNGTGGNAYITVNVKGKWK